MSVYKRGATWWFTKTINGNRIRRRLPTARTKAQAEEGERQELLKLHNARYGINQPAPKLKEFIEKEYLPWSQANKKSWRNDQSRSRCIIEAMGKKRLDEITPFDVEKFKIERRKVKSMRDPESARSVASTNREVLLLSAILTLAKKGRLIIENPCSQVELLAGEVKRTRYLSEEEETRLLDACAGERVWLRPIIILAIHTGMRAGEILSLRWAQVDFSRSLIHLVHTKTDKNRDVPMNQTAREVLLNLTREPEFIFPSPITGRPRRDLNYAWHKLIDEAGIEDLRFHDLRHTFGTRAADRGEPLTAIARVMGHASTATTERYAHATDEGIRRVVESLEKPGHTADTRAGAGKRLSLASG